MHDPAGAGGDPAHRNSLEPHPADGNAGASAHAVAVVAHVSGIWPWCIGRNALSGYVDRPWLVVVFSDRRSTAASFQVIDHEGTQGRREDQV
jgi:hypothetical protein